jgi:hypothetical protein
MSGVGNLCPVSSSRTEDGWFGMCLKWDVRWQGTDEMESSGGCKGGTCNRADTTAEIESEMSEVQNR